jgi:uncharacterized membrane protein
MACMQVGLLGLSLIGWLIALHFTLTFYGVVRANPAYIPAVCRMDDRSCSSILHHRDGRVARVPNALLGVGFYTTVFILSFGLESPSVVVTLRLLSLISLGLGAYLVYSLFARIRVVCILCLVSHVVNLCIALLLFL